MKNIQKRGTRLLVAALILLCWSCDDFTNIALPENQLTSPAVFENEQSATAALMDTYARIRENGTLSGELSGTTLLMGVYSDELAYYGLATTPIDGFWKHTLQPTNEAVASLWSNSYTQIYALNALLEGLEASTALSEEVKEQLKGEALFLRGFLHFNLTNLYGAVPYITTTDYNRNAKVSRLAEAEVYLHVLEDLATSEALLPLAYPSAERVRSNKAAVQALKARVLLYQKSWTAAVEAATTVINNTVYSINPNLDTAFLKDNTSTIWQLHSGVPGANTVEGRLFIFETGPPHIIALQPELVNSFETGDLRKTAWVAEVTDGNSVWYRPNKYKAKGNTGTTQEHSIVLRLEECYLIRAEAHAQLNQLELAKQDLNTIRNRAGLPDVTTSTAETLLQQIQHEKRAEFFTEYGHRWFDLKRTGKAAEVLTPLKPAYKATDLLLPLPESELLLNTNLLPQNPGY